MVCLPPIRPRNRRAASEGPGRPAACQAAIFWAESRTVANLAAGALHLVHRADGDAAAGPKRREGPPDPDSFGGAGRLELLDRHPHIREDEVRLRIGGAEAPVAEELSG